MPPAARVGDQTQHGGVITGPGATTVLIGFRPAAREGDYHVCPMSDPGPKPHVGGPIVGHSATVEIEMAMAARKFDKAACNSVGVSGAGVPPVVGSGVPPVKKSWVFAPGLDPGGLRLKPMDPDRERSWLQVLPLDVAVSDTDQDGTYDTQDGTVSVLRRNNGGDVNLVDGGALGGLEVGMQDHSDWFYAREHLEAHGDSVGVPGGGGSAQVEAGVNTRSNRRWVGPADDHGANPYLAHELTVTAGMVETPHGGFLLGDDGDRVGLGADLELWTGPAFGGGTIAEIMSKSTVTTPTVGGANAQWNLTLGGGVSPTPGAGLGAYLYYDKSDGRVYFKWYLAGDFAGKGDIIFEWSAGRAFQSEGAKGASAGCSLDMITTGEESVLIG